MSGLMCTHLSRVERISRASYTVVDDQLAGFVLSSSRLCGVSIQLECLVSKLKVWRALKKPCGEAQGRQCRSTQEERRQQQLSKMQDNPRLRHLHMDMVRPLLAASTNNRRAHFRVIPQFHRVHDVVRLFGIPGAVVSPHGETVLRLNESDQCKPVFVNGGDCDTQ